MFYSFFFGLLSGNSNIVKIPSKQFPEKEIILSTIKKLFKRKNYLNLKNFNFFIQYDEKIENTKKISSICDCRVIWGGDETINQIRQNQIPPRAFEITFADRYSICAINADKFIDDRNPKKIALGFYNDTYLFDQNACTSPHLIIWLGSKSNIQSSQKN